MFGNFHLADNIAWRFARIDNYCREELRTGIIVSERDYVSCLSSRIRDEFRNLPVFAQTLRQGTEQENGVDGLILFQFNSEIKIGWYEAKWPRVMLADYAWDRVPPGHNLSHFTLQLLKQRHWEGQVALWEMFFNESDDGFESPPFEYFGSSCVWHRNAFDYMRHQGILFEPWATDQLKLLLETNGINFYTVIYDMLSCKKGKRIKLDTGQKYVSISGLKESDRVVNVPLPISISAEYDEKIVEFMKERNIAGYVLFDLSKSAEFSI
jgi:hypothetical protein